MFRKRIIMDKTIELVNLWGAYARQHPDAEIDDFCRHLLLTKKEKSKKEILVGGVVPPNPDSLLMKIIGRIYKLHTSYIQSAFEGIDLNQIEEFGILATIQQYGNPRKSEVIIANLMEISSGTDILNRLIKRGLIKEYLDEQDKRSKRIELTAEGQETFNLAQERALMLAGMMFNDMAEDDKRLCIQLLKNVEIKFSGLVQKHKGRNFDEIYCEILK